MPRPLSHIRVLDLTRVLAGPWASQNLADLGAEVIKIERPGSGDDTRSWGPPFLKDRNGKETGESAYFLSVNRGKKSVTLDIATPEGGEDRARAGCEVRRAARELQGRRPREIRARLRRPEEAQSRASSTARSPGTARAVRSAHRPGYDFIFQGMGGLMSITGERDELPGGGPQKVGIAVTDVMAGMYASVAITAALAAPRAHRRGPVHRHRAARHHRRLRREPDLQLLPFGKRPGALGQRAPEPAPLRGLPHLGRPPDPRRGQRQPVGELLRGGRAARARRRSALQDHARPHPQPPGAHPDRAGHHEDAARAATGSSGSMRPTSPAARSTTTRKCSRTRRCGTAG